MTKLTDRDYALRHRYRTEPGGPFVPGVTTVIGVIEKGGLKWAASEIAARSAVENARRKPSIVKKHRQFLSEARGNSQSTQKKRALAEMGTDADVYIHWARGEFDRVWRAKADRGNRIHEVAERWTRGEAVEVRDEDAGYVDALENFFRAYRPTFHLVEQIVVNAEHAYGGRFDFTAELNGPGAEGQYLCDWKSGATYGFEAALQAEGYLQGQLAEWDEDGNLTGSRCLPNVDGARTIYLRADGQISVFDPFETVSRDDAWRAFLACRTLYEITNKTNKGDTE